jgi:hypothetical protein
MKSSGAIFKIETAFLVSLSSKVGGN